MKSFINCLYQIIMITYCIFILPWAFKSIPVLYEIRANNLLSQRSIFIRDPKSIDYINFKVTSVWTVCQKCHFDSVAWHRYRKEKDI